jgi:hypothetical protein
VQQPAAARGLLLKLAKRRMLGEHARLGGIEHHANYAPQRPPGSWRSLPAPAGPGGAGLPGGAHASYLRQLRLPGAVKAPLGWYAAGVPGVGGGWGCVWGEGRGWG